MGSADSASLEEPRNVRWEIARLNGIKPVDAVTIKFKANSDGTAEIRFNIQTDTMIDSKSAIINDVEPIVFQYRSQADIGKRAPDVLSGRGDFPRDLSHLNPTAADQPVSLCLARAGLQSIYDSAGIDGVIRRLLDWLNDAKTESLHEDGWDPVPPISVEDSVIGFLDAQSLQHYAVAEPKGGYGFIGADIIHGKGDAVFVHAEHAILNTEDLPELNAVKTAMKNFNSSGDPTHTTIPAVYCWPAFGKVESNPHYGGWRDMKSFTQGLRDVGLYDSIDEAFIKLDILFGEDQDADKLGHRAIIIIIGLWRPAPLDRTIVGLADDDDARSLELRAYYLRRDLNVTDRWSETTELHDLYGLVPTIPSVLEAVSGEVALVSTVLLGAGAIGSAFADYGIRGGADKLTVIDKDKFLSHNVARHRGDRLHVAEFKTNVIGSMAFNRVQDVDIAMFPGDVGLITDSILAECFADHGQVLDATADPLVRRRLSKLSDVSVPVLRAEVFHQGKLGVYLLTRLDDPQNLNCLFHQLICSAYDDADVRAWLKYEASRTFLEEELLLGFGCRSLTTKMPAYKIEAHASAAYALGKSRLQGLSRPLIAINKIDENGLPLGTKVVDPDPVVVFDPGGDTGQWRVIMTQTVVEKLHHMRTEASPVETGGYLFGAIDEDASEIYVVAVSGEPPGTVATKTSLKLGRWGQTGFEKSFVRRTQGRLPPVGTWHSHPSSSPKASAKDRETVAVFEKEDALRGLPTVMAITGKSSDRVYVMGD